MDLITQERVLERAYRKKMFNFESHSNATNVEDPNGREEVKDFAYESEEIYNVHDSPNKEGKNRRCSNVNFPQFNGEAKYGSVRFEVSIVFSNLEIFKFAVKDYLAFEGKAVKLAKNDKVRCRAHCKVPCLWKVLCS